MNKFIILICTATLLMSCGTSYKLKKFNQFAYEPKNKPFVALVCDNIFPCISSGEDVQIEIVRKDSIIKGDTIPCAKDDEFVVCPDINCNEKIIKKTITKTIEDTRKLEIQKNHYLTEIDNLKVDYEKQIQIYKKSESDLLNEISGLIDENKKLKSEKLAIQKKANKRGWIIYGTLGILAIIGFLKIRKKLSIF